MLMMTMLNGMILMKKMVATMMMVVHRGGGGANFIKVSTFFLIHNDCLGRWFCAVASSRKEKKGDLKTRFLAKT